MVVDLLAQSLLYFIAFLILQTYQFVLDGLSWCKLCKLSIYTWEEWSTDKNMVGKIWVGMTSNNIHLLQFKIWSHLQKQKIWMPVHQNSFRRKKISEISYITFAILHFLKQNAVTKLPLWVLQNLLFFMKPSDTLQIDSFYPKGCKISS